MLIPTNTKTLCAVALAAFLNVSAAFADDDAVPETKTPPPPHAATEAEKAATPTRVSRVVVFPKGARVTRSAEVSLRAGEQEILLSGMPARLAASTLAAETGIPGARVLSVSTETHASAPSATRDAVEAAREKLERARIAHVDLTCRHAEAESRRRALGEFRPSETGAPFPSAFDVQTALRAIAFLEKEADAASRETLRLKKALDEAALVREIAESEYRKISAGAREKETRVRVKIFADADCAGTLELSYFTADAQWRPSYDVVVDPATNATTIVSYGVLSQRTGEDWNGVPVTLSTVNPDASADLPEFRKILITEAFAPRPQPVMLSKSGGGKGRGEGIGSASFGAPPPRAEEKARALDSGGNGMSIALNSGRVVANARDIRLAGGGYVFRNADGVLEHVAAKDVAGISQNYVETQAENESVPAARLRDPAADLRGLEIRRDLARAETIPSAGTPHRCLLGSETYAGDAYLQITPAADGNAYRMLAVTHRDFRPLLAGPANIFYGADFIGEMDVPYTLRDGRVRIPLGVDPRVAVERRVVNAIETVGTFSKSRRKAVEVSVKIRNRTPEKIRVVCDEAVPVSTRDDIEVSAPEFSPAASKFDAKTGLAARDLALEPAQEIDLKTRYEIDFPENFELRERAR
ncbi:MAG: DUF4139 domain-containing protein [Candidatus Spyradosoma sp.]